MHTKVPQRGSHNKAVMRATLVKKPETELDEELLSSTSGTPRKALAKRIGTCTKDFNKDRNPQKRP